MLDHDLLDKAQPKAIARSEGSEAQGDVVELDLDENA